MTTLVEDLIGPHPGPKNGNCNHLTSVGLISPSGWLYLLGEDAIHADFTSHVRWKASKFKPADQAVFMDEYFYEWLFISNSYSGAVRDGPTLSQMETLARWLADCIVLTKTRNPFDKDFTLYMDSKATTFNVVDLIHKYLGRDKVDEMLGALEGSQRRSYQNSSVHKLEVPMSLGWPRVADSANALVKAGYAKRVNMLPTRDGKHIRAEFFGVPSGIDIYVLGHALEHGVAQANGKVRSYKQNEYKSVSTKIGGQRIVLTFRRRYLWEDYEWWVISLVVGATRKVKKRARQAEWPDSMDKITGTSGLAPLRWAFNEIRNFIATHPEAALVIDPSEYRRSRAYLYLSRLGFKQTDRDELVRWPGYQLS